MEARPLFQLADSALEVVEQRESTTRPPHPLGQAIDPGNQALNLVGHRANDRPPDCAKKGPSRRKEVRFAPT